MYIYINSRAFRQTKVKYMYVGHIAQTKKMKKFVSLVSLPPLQDIIADL